MFNNNPIFDQMDAQAMSHKIVDDGMTEYSIGNRTNINAPGNFGNMPIGQNVSVSQPHLRGIDYASDT